MTTTSPFQHFRQQIEHFKTIFEQKALERDEHIEYVEHPLRPQDGPTTCAWHLNEMRCLLDEINRFRQAANLPLFGLEDIAFYETTAAGHCDYSMKLAIICAEAATGRTGKTEQCTSCKHQVRECKTVEWTTGKVCAWCNAQHLNAT